MAKSENNKEYKLIIVGTGPAGYTASIYASRYKVQNLLIGALPGGQIAKAHKVGNFPGFSEVSGMELAQKIEKHVDELGANKIIDNVIDIEKINNQFIVKTANLGSFKSKAVLLATGTRRRKLDLPREHQFLGKGVSYCATCDASFYKNKVVGVVGGANAATTAALLLSDIADKVYIIYRQQNLRGDPIWIDQVKAKPNIKIILNTNVTGLLGNDQLEKVQLDHSYKGANELALDGLFLEIGSIPSTEFIQSLDIETTDKDYIKVGKDQATNIKGLYAAGDITDGSNGFRQVITACSEGAIAANSIYEYLSQLTD
ncbi:FAD-dependent oxidoreductase [Patescibacteria group bacterium]|nr:FAD-dependent oxidoreductase [Patescibacteria group bacterium]